MWKADIRSETDWRASMARAPASRAWLATAAAASAARCASAVASRAASDRCHLALMSCSGCKALRLGSKLLPLPPRRLAGLRPGPGPLRPSSGEEAGEEAAKRTRCVG